MVLEVREPVVGREWTRIYVVRTNDRSFGDCLEAIVGRCCHVPELRPAHLDDLFAIIDDQYETPVYVV